ncbi:hypothetical protein FNF28_00341 [Cafeteria roenbergensis]|uniref:Ribosomal protein L11 C-terminal domain-containing protein n=1 Tax=Cafeteria roenbergensis TaxID=33653 RepID=A0A5A8E4Q1_CAFRO|nr:hypothetical protein FNF28_00341 [Cafeteria roenbergensis]
MHDRRDEGRVADFIVTFESSSFLSVGMYALVSGAATLLACSAWMPEHVPCDSATVPDSRWISGWAAESAGQWARGVVEGLRWGGGAEAEGALPLAGAAGTCPACAVYGPRASVMDAVFFLVQATLVLASFAMLPYTSRLSHRRGGRADASSDGEGGRAPAALQDDGAADKPSALLRPWYGAHPRVRGGELQQLLWYFTVVTLACASAVAAVFLVGGVTWRTLATAYWIRCAFGLLALPFALFKIPVIGPMLLLRSDPTGYDRDGRHGRHPRSRRRSFNMPPKPDASADAKYLFMKVTGGDPAPPSVLAPKLGPLGMSPKKVGDDIQAATKEWKGIKVMVKITIQNRQAGVDVIPTTAPLILKALGVCRDRKKVKEVVHDGNLTMDQVIDIARTMRASSQAREFSGTVKEVLGTCFSVGCSVNGKHPRDIQGMIDSGDVTVGDA